MISFVYQQISLLNTPESGNMSSTKNRLNSVFCLCEFVRDIYVEIDTWGQKLGFRVQKQSFNF